MFFIKKNDFYLNVKTNKLTKKINSASSFQTRKDALKYMNNSLDLIEINSYFKIEVDTSEHYLSFFTSKINTFINKNIYLRENDAKAAIRMFNYQLSNESYRGSKLLRSVFGSNINDTIKPDNMFWHHNVYKMLKNSLRVVRV